MMIGALAAVATTSSSSINDITPGVLGFLVVAGMATALVFLLRSMNKQFRKITPITPDPAASTAVGEDPPSGSGTSS